MYGLNYDRITDHTGLRDARLGDADGSQVPVLPNLRRAVRAVLLHRAQVLGAVLPARRPRRLQSTRQVEEGGRRLRPGRSTSLRRELQAVIETRTQRQWVDTRRPRAGCRSAPLIRGWPASGTTRKMAARQILVEGEHPIAGPFTYVGEPVIVDEQPYTRHAVRPPPSGLTPPRSSRELGYDEPQHHGVYSPAGIGGRRLIALATSRVVGLSVQQRRPSRPGGHRPPASRRPSVPADHLGGAESFRAGRAFQRCRVASRQAHDRVPEPDPLRSTP